MAKRFVKISLATKFRLLFGAAVLGIIAAALAVPWTFTRRLAEQTAQRPGEELTRLRLNEWLARHPTNLAAAEDSESNVVALHTAGDVAGRRGPLLIRLGRDMTSERLDATGRQAMRAFVRNVNQRLAIIRTENDAGRTIYRCFRAVRVEPTCMRCHGPTEPVERQYQPGQLVGVIDVSIPGEDASGWLVKATWWAFIIGGALAGLLAFFLFSLISHRLVLRPVRQLRNLADKVAEGDLSARSRVRTGDELQHLGDSFNEMLDAISTQHEKLRSANRALDLKLDELAEANVTLFHANKVKTEFLANISHELRTPLNSIIGFADLLAETGDERTQRYGSNIAAAARNLLNMINEMLDLAKIEAGKAVVNRERVPVLDMCRTLVALMQPQADKNQTQLRSKLPEDLPVINTDGGKLQQILYNLLSNAIKFTPAGGEVTLSAQQHETTRGGRRVREVSISVADTGPGIPEAEQQRIFEKFYQAERSLTRSSGGTGLGLAISRELTNLLGGRLSLKSSPGHGAVFTVTLPVDEEETSES
ncbi:MAG: ATP-binding protein [Phycisphaerae bacterium]